MTDAVPVLDWVERVAAVGLALSALEWLAIRDVWGQHGPCAWRVMRLRNRRLDSGRLANSLAVLFDSRGTRNLLLAQIAGAAIVVLPASTDVHGAAVAVTAATTLLLRPRMSWGNNGADRLLAVIMTAALLARLVGTPSAAVLVLWFLALQTCLAYWTAGWGKLRQPDWRNGAVLRDVLSSACFGTQAAHEWFERRPASAVWLSRLVIADFVLFPLVFVVPRPLAFGLLVGGAAFHVGTAALMGLSRFPWAFLATYPAVAYCAGL